MPTQGDKAFPENNHPIQVGDIVGVHNGWVYNDNQLFREMNVSDRRRGQVDSEAIFAAIAYGLEAYDGPVGQNATKGRTSRILGATEVTDLLEKPEGAAAVAWLNRGDPGKLHLARISDRPLVIAQTVGGSVVFASEEEVIRDACFGLGLDICYVEHVEEGTYYTVRRGVIASAQSFKPAEDLWYSGRDYGTGATKGSTTRIGGTTTYRLDNGQWVKRSSYGGEVHEAYVDDPFADTSAPVIEAGSERWASTKSSDEDVGAEARRDPRILRWLDRDLLTVANKAIDTSILRYDQRDVAITDWMDDNTNILWGQNYSMDDLTEDAEDNGASLQPGDWVRVYDLGIYRCAYGEVVTMPQTFPAGDYVLRVWLGVGSEKGGYMPILVSRTISDFDVISPHAQATIAALHAQSGVFERKAAEARPINNVTSINDKQLALGTGSEEATCRV